MFKLNVFASTILAAGLCTTALAHSPTSTQLTLPQVKNTWHAGVTALYLEPDLGGNSLGYSSFGNYGTDINNVVVERNGGANDLSNISYDRRWGFQLNLGYDFNTGNDVNLDWYHLYDRTNSSLPNGTLFAGSASALYAGNIDLENHWDAVNLEVGQRFDLNPCNTIRLHAGLSYARIRNTIINYPKLTPNGNPLFITYDTITYTGFGPRIGGDYFYQTPYKFGVFAKAGASLFVGTAKQSVTGYHDIGGFNLYSTGNYNQTNNNVVVPELDANLGLNYDYAFKQGVLGFNLGYMFTTYLNAIVSQVGAGVVSSSISTSSATNFNLNGPYFGITWTGSVC
jgi:hypothetical protein